MTAHAEKTDGTEPGSPDRPVLVLIDDDPLIVDPLVYILRKRFDVHSAASRDEARACLQALKAPPDLALVDLGLPPTPHQPDEGFALIGELLAFNANIKILILSGQSDTANIHHALTLGAVDFIPKPCDVDLLEARLNHQLLIIDAERHAGVSAPDDCGLIGESPAMEALRTQIGQFANNPFPVLIEGESGSGKELVARCLHERSDRAGEPWLSINCAAFTAELLESQLFGHAKGAFTGASSAKAGFFEECGNGTLFLDEIGDLPTGLQSKLLLVLENGEYYRIGETRARRATARIVAATNRDLREAVRCGDFRGDLYHRLSVLTITVPPLRDRGDDVMLLLEHFQAFYAGTVPPFSLDRVAEQRMRTYPFHGNVRELRNIVIRLGSRYPGQRVGVRQLEADLDPDAGPVAGTRPAGGDDDGLKQQIAAGGFSLDRTLGEWERRYIDAAMDLSRGNLSEAARLLGVNRTTLHSRIQRLSRDAGRDEVS